MQTPITCPNCQTPYLTDVHQVIDVGREPSLKQLLLSGQLNVAVCPSCGAAGQLSTPIIYHDPNHELMMIYLPVELNLGHLEREQLIGDLTRKAMNEIPPEQRKAYLLQPQTMLNLQSLMEKVLETEGVTPEMLARQRGQAELLTTLLTTTDRDFRATLVAERMDEIDETFFAMLRQSLDMADQANSESDLIRLTNLQAYLYESTPVGQRLERQQVAIHGLNIAAKKSGLNPELLARHVIQQAEDEAIAVAVALAGQTAMTYEFFQLMTQEIESSRKAGNEIKAGQLERIRDELLAVQQEMRQQTERKLAESDQIIQAILLAPDLASGVQANLDKIDDDLMYVLAVRIAQAEEGGDDAEVQRLESVRVAIQAEIERQMPPEIRLLNQLVSAEDESEQDRILDESGDLISLELVQLLDAVEEQVQEGGDESLLLNLRNLKQKIRLRM